MIHSHCEHVSLLALAFCMGVVSLLYSSSLWKAYSNNILDSYIKLL